MHAMCAAGELDDSVAAGWRHRCALLEQLPEFRQEPVLLLPRGVHETAHVSCVPGEREPALYSIKVIRVVIAGDQCLETLVREKLEAFLARFAPPHSEHQVFGDMSPG